LCSVHVQMYLIECMFNQVEHASVPFKEIQTMKILC
jgi:hypothetical protein